MIDDKTEENIFEFPEGIKNPDEFIDLVRNLCKNKIETTKQEITTATQKGSSDNGKDLEKISTNSAVESSSTETQTKTSTDEKLTANEVNKSETVKADPRRIETLESFFLKNDFPESIKKIIYWDSFYPVETYGFKYEEKLIETLNKIKEPIRKVFEAIKFEESYQKAKNAVEEVVKKANENNYIVEKTLIENAKAKIEEFKKITEDFNLFLISIKKEMTEGDQLNTLKKEYNHEFYIKLERFVLNINLLAFNFYNYSLKDILEKNLKSIHESTPATVSSDGPGKDSYLSSSWFIEYIQQNITGGNKDTGNELRILSIMRNFSSFSVTFASIFYFAFPSALPVIFAKIAIAFFSINLFIDSLRGRSEFLYKTSPAPLVYLKVIIDIFWRALPCIFVSKLLFPNHQQFYRFFKILKFISYPLIYLFSILENLIPGLQIATSIMFANTLSTFLVIATACSFLLVFSSFTKAHNFNCGYGLDRTQCSNLNKENPSLYNKIQENRQISSVKLFFVKLLLTIFSVVFPVAWFSESTWVWKKLGIMSKELGETKENQCSMASWFECLFPSNVVSGAKEESTEKPKKEEERELCTKTEYKSATDNQEKQSEDTPTGSLIQVQSGSEQPTTGTALVAQ